MPMQVKKHQGLYCRLRQKKDDPFIIGVALQTMQRIYKQSTGHVLTKRMIIQQLQSNSTTMVVESGSTPIGYYSYTILSPSTLYLSALVLAKAAQGRGIGQRIARQIEREAREQGAKTILAHVQVTNARAISFWLKNGYRILHPQMKGMLAIEKILPNKAVSRPSWC